MPSFTDTAETFITNIEQSLLDGNPEKAQQAVAELITINRSQAITYLKTNHFFTYPNSLALLSITLENTRLETESPTWFKINAAFFLALSGQREPAILNIQAWLAINKNGLIHKLSEAKLIQKNPLFYALLAHVLANTETELVARQQWLLAEILYSTLARNMTHAQQATQRLLNTQDGHNWLITELSVTRNPDYPNTYYALLTEALSQQSPPPSASVTRTPQTLFYYMEASTATESRPKDIVNQDNSLVRNA